jgi:SAM-dependent methyltransferase
MSDAYHTTRLVYDRRRETVWRALYRYYFRHLIPADACVLDLGCGYGDFINAVQARRRIALDRWPDFPRYLEPGVEPIVTDCLDFSALPDRGVDVVFASNFFEHISQEDFASVLRRLRPKLSMRGQLMILQPNYRYAYREYFDDYTHVSVWTDTSICDFLSAQNFEVLNVQPKFLPLTVKSRLPVWPFLIRAWLLSPFKPTGKQMLITARHRFIKQECRT